MEVRNGITMIFKYCRLVCTNLAVYYVTRKRPRSRTHPSSTTPTNSSHRSTPSFLLEENHALRSSKYPGASTSSGSSLNDISCCQTSANCTSSQQQREERPLVANSGEEAGFWAQFPRLLLLSVASIFVPAGYNNDYRSHHPRIKGGLFILLNHTFDMLWIGLALGFTIINNVPNSIKGVSLPQPSLKVQVIVKLLMSLHGKFENALIVFYSSFRRVAA